MPVYDLSVLSFGLFWVFVARRGLSPVVVSGGDHSGCGGLSLGSTGSRHPDSVLVVLGLSCSTACGVSPTSGQARVPGTSRWILTHCTPGKSLISDFPCQNHFGGLPHTLCLMHVSHDDLIEQLGSVSLLPLAVILRDTLLGLQYEANHWGVQALLSGGS